MTPSLSFHRTLVTLLLFVTFFGGTTWGQNTPDTRGSVVPDGKVTLADGTSVEVQDLRAGATLWSWLPTGTAGTTKVTSVRRQHSDSFLLVKAGAKELRATGAHRVALAGGKLVRLDTVKAGDKIWIEGTGGPTDAVVTSVRVFPSTLITYDLTTQGHGTFLLDGVVVGD